MAAPVGQIEARRIGADVYVTLVVPAQNVDSSSPADVSRIDVFAVSAGAPPPRSRFLQLGTRIASVPVMPPPLPDSADRAPAAQTGASQGSAITIRETLSADDLIPKAIPVEEDAGGADRTRDATRASQTTAAPKPDDKAPDAKDGVPRRYYMAFAFSNRQRMSAAGAVAAVSLAPPPEAPANVAVKYTAESISLSWAPSGEVSSYNIYRDEQVEGSPPRSEEPSWRATIPAPVNQEPVSVLTYAEAVEFGRERCYRIRAVRSADGGAVESDPSERTCITPRDTFKPAAPTALSALASGGGISLKWAPSSDKDVVGYLILRGRPGDATLLPIGDMTVKETQFVDQSVTPGVRYVYAVVAVDGATPPNRSAESERDEETAQ